MVTDLVCELHRLEFCFLLIALALCLLLLLLEEELPIIHDLRHSDPILHTDFYEIEVLTSCEVQSLVSCHLPERLSAIRDNHEFSCGDGIIDAFFVFLLGKTLFLHGHLGCYRSCDLGECTLFTSSIVLVEYILLFESIDTRIYE